MVRSVYILFHHGLEVGSICRVRSFFFLCEVELLFFHTNPKSAQQFLSIFFVWCVFFTWCLFWFLWVFNWGHLNIFVFDWLRNWVGAICRCLCARHFFNSAPPKQKMIVLFVWIDAVGVVSVACRVQWKLSKCADAICMDCRDLFHHGDRDNWISTWKSLELKMLLEIKISLDVN